MHRLRQHAAWEPGNCCGPAAAETGSLNTSPWMHSASVARESLSAPVRSLQTGDGCTSTSGAQARGGQSGLVLTSVASARLGGRALARRAICRASLRLCSGCSAFGTSADACKDEPTIIVDDEHCSFRRCAQSRSQNLTCYGTFQHVYRITLTSPAAANTRSSFLRYRSCRVCLHDHVRVNAL